MDEIRQFSLCMMAGCGVATAGQALTVPSAWLVLLFALVYALTALKP